MRVHALRLLVLFALGGLGIALVLGSRELQLDPPPERLPATLRFVPDGPSVWVFVRPGCAHCERHMRALGRAAGALSGQMRAVARARLGIVGTCASLPEGVRALPASYRAALGVRWTPTTWFVDSEGRIRAAWIGARGVHAWSQALVELVRESPS